MSGRSSYKLTDGPRNVTEFVRPKWSHLEYSWQLDNFWELRALACVEALDDENGSLIWSQSFGDNERGMWQLKLYPYGDLSTAGRGHVSLFLSLDLKSLPVPKAYSVFGCYLLDEEGAKIANSGRSFTRQKFAEGSSSWGWSQFVKVEGQSLNRLLNSPNDSFVVKCEIEVFVGVITSPPTHLPAPTTWEQDLKAHLCDPRHYNITLVVDGREIRAHKEVLTARSKWFADRISSSTLAKATSLPSTIVDRRTAAPTPASNPDTLLYQTFGSFNEKSADDIQISVTNTDDVLVIDQFRGEVVENLVQYMHTDDCAYFATSTRLTDLLELFIAAKELQISSLYVNLQSKLCALVITKPNAIAIQEVAKRLCDKDVEAHCASHLLLSVRDLTKEEILKTLAPNMNVRNTLQ